jgi:hypothetical protein
LAIGTPTRSWIANLGNALGATVAIVPGAARPRRGGPAFTKTPPCAPASVRWFVTTVIRENKPGTAAAVM